MIVGHTDCAAVKTTINKLKESKPPGFLTPIANAAKERTYDPDALAADHVREACHTLKNHKSIQSLEREVTIIGGMFDVHTGNMEFFS